MLTGHLISSIESSEFTARIRLAIFPPIGLPVFTTIFSAIHSTIFAPVFPPVVVYIADIVPSTATAAVAFTARPAVG
jgi:hypothetical protein